MGDSGEARLLYVHIILVCFNVLIINKVEPEDADQAAGVMDKLGYSLGS